MCRGIAACALLLTAVGCTTSGTPINGGSVPPPTGFQYLTGNWVFTLSPTSSNVPFTQLAGFLYEQDGQPGVNDAVSAALQATTGSSSCYAGAQTVPLEGSLQKSALTLRSFDVNGQYLNLAANEGDTTATTLTGGTYNISGGCGGGATGNFTGQRYAVLANDTYTGTFPGSAAQSLAITLNQNINGTGSGNFFVSGTANFTGFSCFTSGTLPSTSGTIVGNALQLTFNTNDVNGSQVVLAGTIDPTATTITLTSASVVGGACAATLGTPTLNHQ